MAYGQSGDQELLRTWLSSFLEDEFVTTVAERTGRQPDWCRQILGTFTNEAVTYLPLLADKLRPGIRILEVGSGIGFLSLWLRDQGFDITPLDPAGGPFDVFEILSAAVAERAGGDTSHLLRIGVEQLDPAAHGVFDLIYSFNVLEHVGELDAAFEAMTSVLAPAGSMLHVCPNYWFPYEPHLGIPLVPLAPTATVRLFPSVVAQNRVVWDSLNFITAGRVKKLIQRHGLEGRLLPGQMTAQIDRLTKDPVFAARHLGGSTGRALLAFLRALEAAGLLRLLRRIPPALLTPMAISIQKPGAST